jgi:hypothetical protein
MHRRNEAVLAAIEARQEQVLGALAKWAKEADEQRRHEAVLAAQADELRRHEAVLAAQADGQRRHEGGLRNAVATRQCWRRRQPMNNIGTSQPHELRSPMR